MITPPILPLKRQPKYIPTNKELAEADIFYMVSDTQTNCLPLLSHIPTDLFLPCRSLVHPNVTTPDQAHVVVSHEIRSESEPTSSEYVFPKPTPMTRSPLLCFNTMCFNDAQDQSPEESSSHVVKKLDFSSWYDT